MRGITRTFSTQRVPTLSSARSAQLNQDYSQLAEAQPFLRVPYTPAARLGSNQAVTKLDLGAPLAMLMDPKSGIHLTRQQRKHLLLASCFKSLQSQRRGRQ